MNDEEQVNEKVSSLSEFKDEVVSFIYDHLEFPGDYDEMKGWVENIFGYEMDAILDFEAYPDVDFELDAVTIPQLYKFRDQWNADFGDSQTWEIITEY